MLYVWHSVRKCISDSTELGQNGQNHANVCIIISPMCTDIRGLTKIFISLFRFVYVYVSMRTSEDEFEKRYSSHLHVCST